MSSAETSWAHLYKESKDAEVKMLNELFDQQVVRLEADLKAIKIALHESESKAAHFEALYDEAKKARDEWKDMVISLIPNKK